MRKLSLTLVVLTLGWLSAHAQGQENATKVLNSKLRHFKIPFEPVQQNIRKLLMYSSADQGKSWTLQATASPEQGKFNIALERDGLYWFTVQTIDTENRKSPADLDNAQPLMKVLVDTVPPRVTLQALPPRNGEVGVRWDIDEKNMDWVLNDAVRLEYRQAGSMSWIPLPITPNAQQFYWNPQTVANVEVQLLVRDQVGNWGKATVVTSINGNGNAGVQPAFPPPPPPAAPPAGSSLPSDAERKYVNSTKITLNYQLNKVGPSGVSQIELWYTLDGRNWQQYKDLKFGGDVNQKSVTFDVVGEGLYGMSLIPRSGVGLGERPPQTGDRPQVWIEVDTTRPVIKLHTPVVGHPDGPDKGKVIFSWTASDKNLQAEPISLYYAENPTGPWTPIKGAEKLPNTIRYVWVLPENPPYKIYVKAEAIDKARNVGEAITPDVVVIDQQKPTASITGVEAAPAQQK